MFSVPCFHLELFFQFFFVLRKEITESSRNIDIGIRFRIVIYVGLKRKELFRSKKIACNSLLCIILPLDNILFLGE